MVFKKVRKIVVNLAHAVVTKKKSDENEKERNIGLEIRGLTIYTILFLALNRFNERFRWELIASVRQCCVFILIDEHDLWMGLAGFLEILIAALYTSFMSATPLPFLQHLHRLFPEYSKQPPSRQHRHRHQLPRTQTILLRNGLQDPRTPHPLPHAAN